MSRQPLIGFAAMLLGAACAGAVEVAQEHPRIFVKKSELPALAKRCSRGGAVAAEYSAIKRAVDGYMSGRRAMNGATLPSLCIVYQVEKALGNDVAKYVDYLKRGLWGSDGKGGGSNLPAGRQWYPRGTGSVREGYMGGRGTWYAWDAMCYDWFYDALTPEERVKYGNILGRWLHSFMGLKPNHPAKITLRYGSYLYNQTWGCCEGYAWGNYYCRDGVGCKTFVALAIHGEDTRYGRSAEEWLASWEDMVPTRFIPLIRRQGGVWTAGGGHGGATAQAVMLTLEAWRVATGQDLFGRFKGDGLRHLIYWPLYAQMPHNGYWAHLDDMFMYRTHHGLTSRVAPLAGKHFRQPVAQMMLQDLSVERRSWPYVLWYDPSVPAAALSELPLGFHFKGVGHVYSRSAWESPDATWAFFDCGPHFAGYQSDDNGHFELHKGGVLAARSGTGYGGGKRTFSNNAVLICDSPRKPSDGGVLPGAGYVNQAVRRGRMIAFGNTREWTYACGDLTGAYGLNRTRSYLRHFLYLRGDPECLIVYDRVVTSKADIPKMWLLHTINEARVMKGTSDAPATASGRGFKTFGDADGAIVSNHTPEGNPRKHRRRFLASGLGAMRVVALLPKGAKITSRGGKGYDNWGCPYDPQSNKNFDAPRGQDHTSMDRTWWRIEVEPRERAAATEFLHVLLPKLMPNGAEKTAFELSTGEFGSAELTAESAAELELRVRAGNGEWLIRLKRGGGPGGRVERGGTSWPLPTKNMPNGSTIEARPPKPSPGGARRGPGP